MKSWPGEGGRPILHTKTRRHRLVKLRYALAEAQLKSEISYFVFHMFYFQNPQKRTVSGHFFFVVVIFN